MFEWCKIFNTEFGQVLFYVEYDSDEDGYKFHQMFRFEIGLCDSALSGFNEDTTIEQIMEVCATQDAADKIAKQFNSMFKEKP